MKIIRGPNPSFAPAATRSPTALHKTIDELGMRLRRRALEGGGAP